MASRYERLSPSDESELRNLIAAPAELAQAALWSALLSIATGSQLGESIHAWLNSDEVDWDVISEAAELALKRWGKGSGDYPNVALHAAVSELIELYEWYTGHSAAQHNGKSEAPPLYTLAHRFFAVVDEDLAERTINSAITVDLKARRAKTRRARTTP